MGILWENEFSGVTQKSMPFIKYFFSGPFRGAIIPMHVYESVFMASFWKKIEVIHFGEVGSVEQRFFDFVH
jgi:hypothetical protein